MSDDRDEASSTAAAPPRPATSGSDLWRIALRRRRFLVDRRYQLRASLIAVGIAVVLLVLLNVSLFLGDPGSAEGPSASPAGAQLALVVVGSLVFLVGVFLISVLETHRTSGAALKIGRAMEKIRTGRLKTRLRLRRGDNLQDLAVAFNAMTGALHERAWEEIEALEAAAARIESAGGDPSAAAEAGKILRRLAQERRRSIG